MINRGNIKIWFSTLYEETTEIQVLALIGRKVIQSCGELLQKLTKTIYKFCEENREDKQLSTHIEKSISLNKQLTDLSMKVVVDGMMDPEKLALLRWTLCISLDMSLLPTSELG